MKTHTNQFKLISIFTLLSLCSLLQAQVNKPEQERRSQTIQSEEIPQGLSDSEWNSIQQQVKQAKYQPYSDKKGGYRSANPAHDWQIHYAANGTTTLTPRNKPTKPYKLGMKLNAIGYQTLQSLESPETISQKNFTITYQWNDNLREWWINSEQQLEQWFVLQHKPEGNNKQNPLTLQMTLQSELKTELRNNTLTFTNAAGTNISYNKLKVWDAQGKTIPAQMKLTGNTLSLLVDDQQAQYPLTIDPSFTQQTYLKASNTDEGDQFGFSVAISNNTLVVGARNESSNSIGVNDDENNNLASRSGAAYVFTHSGSSWSQQAYLKASNTDVGNQFGFSVAISGDTLVVGSPTENSDLSGAAYVFTRTGSSWSQQAYLKASNAENLDQFGNSVAISDDTLVVGASFESSNSTGVNGDEDNNSAENSGAAYVFTRSGSSWSQQAYLKASNTDASDKFGHSVAIFGDTLVVGALNEASNSIGLNGEENNNSASRSGAAYLFTRSGSSWNQQAYLKASNTGENDYFGWSIAISNDTVVVGAFAEDSNSTGVNGDENNNLGSGSGAAYVFTGSGSSWSQQAYLKASNVGDLGLPHRFGRSVAISGDNLVVGAETEFSNSTGVNGDESNNSAPRSGAAYVFTRSGPSWEQQAYLKASNTENNDRFGKSVAIFSDTVAVGAFAEDNDSTGINGDDSNNLADFSGASYVFTVIPPHRLPNNQWHLVSLPMNPKTSNTVANIFGDDGLGTYDDTWIVYYYDITSNSYVKPALTDTLSQGVGYWIIQNTGNDKTLEMPIGSATTPSTPSAGCSSTNCFSILLGTEAGTEQLNLLGYPYGKSQLFSGSRISTDSLDCNPSCTLAVAKENNIFHNQLRTYDSSSGYSLINITDSLDPWMGYWGTTLNAADGTNPVLMIPKP